MKILLVDDSTTLAKLNSMFIKKAGHEVIFAEDGQIGVAKAKAEKPNLILMDAEMPVMDGWEACEALKADSETRDIPIVMCTGDNSPEYLEKARRIGAVGYLAKPFKPSTLIEEIAKHH